MPTNLLGRPESVGLLVERFLEDNSGRLPMPHYSLDNGRGLDFGIKTVDTVFPITIGTTIFLPKSLIKTMLDYRLEAK